MSAMRTAPAILNLPLFLLPYPTSLPPGAHASPLRQCPAVPLGESAGAERARSLGAVDPFVDAPGRDLEPVAKVFARRVNQRSWRCSRRQGPDKDPKTRPDTKASEPAASGNPQGQELSSRGIPASNRLALAWTHGSPVLSFRCSPLREARRPTPSCSQNARPPVQ